MFNNILSALRASLPFFILYGWFLFLAGVTFVLTPFLVNLHSTLVLALVVLVLPPTVFAGSVAISTLAFRIKKSNTNGDSQS